MVTETVEKFLIESNAIEGVYDNDSLIQAKKAWSYIILEPELTVENILVTHAILMKNKEIEDRHKGAFRDCAVWIGGRQGKFWFALPELMSRWVKRANNVKTEEEIKKSHVEYEDIHPFVDGNGRTGRIFLNWQRVKNGLPVLVIEEAKKRDYYKWFQKDNYKWYDNI